MQYRLELVLKPAEGALLRVLGMVERRGFTAHDIAGQRSVEGWRVQMEISGQRPPETLRHQLEKIYDCESVQIVALGTLPPAAGATA